MSPSTGPFGPPPQIFLDIDAAMRRGDMSTAIALARLAIDQGHRHPVVFSLRAYWHESEGRFSSAVDDLERALQLAPGDPKTLNAIGRCLTSMGRFPDAVATLDSAIAIAPKLAEAHYNKGFALEQLAEIVHAETAYERALKLDPAMTDAMARLASLAARRSDWTRARAFANKALAAEPHHSVAQFAHVMADMAVGDYAEAERRARSVIADAYAVPQARANAQNFLADALDAQNRTDEAFAAYNAANAGLKDVFRERFEAPGDETGLELVTRWMHDVDQAPAKFWMTQNVASGEASPVFLLGFPRSGTTLLGQILASHPRVVTLEEKPLLREAIQDFQIDKDKIGNLATLSDAERDRYRSLYWQHVREAGVEAGDRLIVDQSPFDTMYLPIIAKLFPQAKIVFAVRDPRDVVLSCFRRLFVLNRYVYEFLSLESTARFYDATMRLRELYRSRLPLNLCAVKNEDLIADFEGTTRGICDFLGLGWEQSMADFAERSKARAVATPSSTQVARGINSEGVGQWRRYVNEMQDVLPILAPWVERLGYEPS